MPASYSKIKSRTGGPSIGTIMCVPKSSQWSDSGDEGTESSRWRISGPNTTGYSSTERFPGWFECDGRSLIKANYPMLYEVIGDTYGSTSTTFNLPDYRGKRLCGTGNVDSNRGGGGTLTPEFSPTYTEGGSPDQAGSVGGSYEVSVTRFAPAGSEITPGVPTGEFVLYYVTDSFITSKDSFNNTALGNFGDGIGEYGFFAKPDFIGIGDQYVRFHSESANLSGNRSYRISSLNLSDYTKVYITAIAGNDNNGGERPNDAGDSLFVRFIKSNGSGAASSDYKLIATKGDPDSEFGGEDDFEKWDLAFSTWQQQVVEIPTGWRENNVQIEIFQNPDGAPVGSELNNPTRDFYDPNDPPEDIKDAYGILSIGFSGGNFGGDATDTFQIGTVRTLGFENLNAVVEPNFTGTISFSAGNNGTGNRGGTSERSIFGVPPHSHFVSGINASGGTVFVATASEQFTPEKRINTFEDGLCTFKSYNRSGRSIKSHSHLLAWGFTPEPFATYGNDNGYGSSDLVNALDIGGLYGESRASFRSDDIGEKINKTLDVSNILGVTLNVADFEMRPNSRLEFDNALDVYLEAGEGVNLASTYTRLKYIIRAW